MTFGTHPADAPRSWPQPAGGDEMASAHTPDRDATLDGDRDGREIRLRARATRLILPVLLLWAAAWAVPQHWGAAGAGMRWVLAVVALVIVVLLISAWTSWRSRACRLTDETVAMTEGVLRRHLRQMPLDTISSVEMHQSLSQRFWGSGDIRLVAGDQFSLVLKSMPDPTSLREAILERSAQARARRDRYRLAAITTQPMQPPTSPGAGPRFAIAPPSAERFPQS
ncbi:PH domain-containing protein [Pseudoclavibacter sp. 13-3]|uniref:PH domain-containing protein n=1 Tax=Pseudoclavibacter sp. 13-3 TaxID=2901228 RepID=UPI001E493AFB|nr:PH domain-containing protein [Pseudoclavibacter sp. 13-3]MCD7102368.1 PH domain-containing protein [Pseudoclavibacter sp. 13-3]